MSWLHIALAAALAVAPLCAQSPSPASLGDADARWSATTEEAASAPENKAWLARGRAATITGEVVDVSCYLQLGKRGKGHIDCGARCVRAGQPGGLVDDAGELYVLIAEQHHPRRDGQVSLRTWIATHMAARATVTGVLAEERGHKALFVTAPPADATPLPETVPHTTPAAPGVPPPGASAAPPSPASATPPTTSPLPDASPSPRPELVPDVAPSPR